MLYTVGYEGKSVEQLKALLLAAGVKKVVDVRQYPVSRWRPEYSKTRLSEALASARIEYEHISELGTPKKARDEFRRTGDAVAMHREYARHLAGQTSTVAELSRMAETLAICLMCYEHQASDCHRSYLAGELVLDNGGKVTHLA